MNVKGKVHRYFIGDHGTVSSSGIQFFHFFDPCDIGPKWRKSNPAIGPNRDTIKSTVAAIGIKNPLKIYLISKLETVP